MKHTEYSDACTRDLRYPLGGIGTGGFQLSGGGCPGLFCLFGEKRQAFFHFALRADSGEHRECRLLNVRNEEAQGALHFDAAPFSVRFPYAYLNFSHDGFPGKVSLCAFNPLLPLNHIDSSIPAAFFEFELENISKEPVNYTLCAAMENPLPEGITRFDGDIRCNMKGLVFGSRRDVMDDGALQSAYNAKGLCLATDSEEVSYREYYPVESGHPSVLLEALNQAPFPSAPSESISDARHMGLLAAHISLLPGEKTTVRFIAAHYMRHALDQPRSESPSPLPVSSARRIPNNFYSRFFNSAKDCAAYCFLQWERLKAETSLFSNALYESTFPDEALEGIVTGLSALKSPDFVRPGDNGLCHADTLLPAELPAECALWHLYAPKLWQQNSNRAASAEKSVFSNAEERFRQGADEQAWEQLRQEQALPEKREKFPFGNPVSDTEWRRLMSRYGLAAMLCGFSYCPEESQIRFEPLLHFSDKDGYFKGLFAAQTAYGTVEVGPKYLEMKLIRGELWLRRFSLFSEPKVVYCGGRKFGFHAEGNTAVLDVRVKCTPEKGITVIYD